MRLLLKGVFWGSAVKKEHKSPPNFFDGLLLHNILILSLQDHYQPK